MICTTCGNSMAANGACYTCHPVAIPIALTRQTNALLSTLCELSGITDREAALRGALIARLRTVFSNNGPAVRAAKARGVTLAHILRER